VSNAWRQGIGEAELSPAVRAALSDMEARQAAEMRSVLAGTTASMADGARVETETPVGMPAGVILRTMRDRTADLVAIGHRRRCDGHRPGGLIRVV
jgi:nucleotide-binding universal stress UspA family protein